MEEKSPQSDQKVPRLCLKVPGGFVMDITGKMGLFVFSLRMLICIATGDIPHPAAKCALK